MGTPVYFFVKFCELEKYAEAFVAGKLWMNPLLFFKELEKKDDGRADRHEGATAWYQPAMLGSLQIGSVAIAPSEIAGPVVVQDCADDNRNVMCLYAAMPPFSTVTEENLAALREQLEIPPACRKMGRYAVVVHSSAAFLKRVDEAAKAKRVTVERGPVEYFAAGGFSGKVRHPVFAKTDDYRWQREYRIAVDRNASAPEPFVLDVGPLHHVCEIVESIHLNGVKVSLPE